MKRRKIIASLSILTIVCTLLTGCKKTAATVKKSDVAMGRYVETDIAMPEGVANGDEVAYEMEKNPEGKIEIYASPNKGDGIIRYVYNQDGTWERTLPEWMNQDKYYLFCVGYDPSGACYAIKGTYDKEDNIILSLMKTTDDKTIKKIKIDDYEKKDEILSCPVNLIVIDENTFITTDQMQVHYYKNGKSIGSDKISDYVCASTDNQLLLCSSDDTGIDLVNSSTRMIEKKYAFDGLTEEQKLLGIDSKGNYYLATRDGVYRITKGGSTWEEIMNGRLCTLCQPSSNLEAMKMGENDDFYIMYQGAGGKRTIKYYSYDPNMPTNPSTILTIVSLKQCETVKQAMLAFENSHQDLLVDYRVLLSNDSDEANKMEYIKTLNTELLAGNGPDMILMDGLAIQPYIDKGVLEDLSVPMKSYLDSNELLPNVVAASKTENKIYTFPLKVGITYAYGMKDAVKSADTIESIAAYAKTVAKKPLFAKHYIPYSGLAEFMYNYYSYEFVTKDGIQEDKLRSFLTSLNDIAVQTEAIKDDDNWGYWPDDKYFVETCQSDDLYAKEAELGLVTMNDMISCYVPYTINDKIDGASSSIHGQYTMNGQIAINAESKHKELAGEFLQLLLSEDIQSKSLATGFPVNKKALENYELYDDDFCFGNETFEASQPEDKQKLKDILNLCADLTTPIIIDEILKDMVLTEITPYLEGETDLDTVVANIMNKANTYLEE